MMRSVLDTTFFLFFLFQFVGTLGMDTQALFPAWLYPDMLRRVFAFYLETYRDPYMADVTKWPWFMTVCLVEFTIGIPFFFVATYAYLKGAERCPWIRIPVIIYCSHVMTATFGIILNTMMLPDFAPHTSAPAPRDLHERLKLTGVYFMFFFVPLLNLLDAVFSSAYQVPINSKEKRQ